MSKKQSMDAEQITRFPSLIAALLGALLTLSFAPFNIFPFAILAPAGLMSLTFKQEPGRAAKLGFIFGLGLFTTGIYWIFISIHQFGHIPTLAAAGLALLLMMTLSLYYAATCYLANRYFPNKSDISFGFSFAGIWMLLEWLRSSLFTGFPWLTLGYSQINSPLKGYAPLFSVYGVSLAALISSTLLFNVYLCYRKKQSYRMYQQFTIFLGIWVIGGALAFIPWTQPSGKPLSVSLVQGNIPQSIKWSATHNQLSLDRYKELTSSLWGKNDLIIWPEAAIPASLQSASTYINELDEKAKSTGSSLILGIPIASADGDTFHNSIITLGKNLAVYNKRHLVPFGEYVPFKETLGKALDFLHVPIPNMISGELSQKPLQINNLKILPSICYEIAFPVLMLTSNPDIGILLTVTNDAWFGHSTAQAQHLEMARMRAIELARPVAFVGNDGFTGLIDPKGNITASVKPYETAVLSAKIQPMYGLTPWMTNGMDPILFIMLCILAAYKFQPLFIRYIEDKNTSPITLTK